jgi:hypothetical protein
MKTLILFLISTFILSASPDPDLKASFIVGDADIQSINSISFGPDGILFIGDSNSAQLTAIDTNDDQEAFEVEDLDIKKIDSKIASKLGTDINSFSIKDMAVNPVSKNIYLAIHMSDGTPALLRIMNGEIEGVPLNNISHSKAQINYALAKEAKDKRGRSLRKWTISDMSYSEGNVMVSGLSNREFSSTFTSIPFPFNNKEQHYSTLELYHAAHGRFETYAPVSSFTTASLNGKNHLVAGYTCTPLVVYPMDKLTPGQHVTGRTVAELGNRNKPVDIISVHHKGNSYILVANSSRQLMKISYEAIESFDGSLVEKVSENSGTAGVEFIALPLVNILQLDNLDDSRILMLQRKSNGDLDLFSSKLDKWM